MGICRRQCVWVIYKNTFFKYNQFNPHKIYIQAIKYVKAGAQAEIVKDLIKRDILTEKEKDIVRRGRNTRNHHLPKNASIEEYSMATGFEALIGYLYLNKEDERLDKILSEIIN